jgi:hypothetical protein
MLGKAFGLFFKKNSEDKTSVPQVTTINPLELTTGNATQVTGLFADWFSFHLDIKTDLVMAEILMQELHLSRQQAFEKLARNKQALAKLLEKDSHQDLETIWNDFFASQRYQLSTALQIKKAIIANPLQNYTEIIVQTRHVFQQKAMPPVSLEEMRLYRLGEILNSWVNWEQAKQQIQGPLESLRAVLTHYKRPFPYHFFSQHIFDTAHFPFVRFLHEAALLWKQLQKGDMFADIQNRGTLSTALLEQPYLSALGEDWQQQEILDKLFSPASAQEEQAIYFNGLVLKGAIGKSFAELIDNPALEKLPDYKRLNTGQRTALLKEKFKQIGESTQYEMGSLDHSLASIVIRIFYYQHAMLPQAFTSQAQLIDMFKQIETEWKIKKNYPLQPRLLLALHLAESNNITISGDSWQDKVKYLFTYLANEFEKLFLEAPYFDRIKAAEKILRDLGMTNREIRKKRHYVIEADNFNLSQTYFGSPLEQFLVLADRHGVVRHQMYHQGKSVNPRTALQKAEEIFNANLYQDLWVQNKAKSNLNKPYAFANDTEIIQEAKRIATNYVAETENHRAWVHGLKTWLSTIPIIGPLYTIEEGIRDKDPVEVVCGIFFLGLDAIDLLAGGEPEAAGLDGIGIRKSLSVRECMTVDSVDMAFKKLDVSIADLPLDDRIVLKGHSLAIEQDREIPDTYYALAKQVREGLQGLRWHDYELVYLSNEDRVVLVKSQGGYFREVDWQSGKIELTKPLIFRDATLKQYYTSTGLKGGTRDYDAGLSAGSELMHRNTVEKTLLVLDQADDFRQYAFETLFKQHFSIQVQTDASTFDAFAFYTTLYKTSPTFRRIFNHFANRPGQLGIDGASWKLEINIGVISRTDFATKTIHIASDNEISQIYYVGSQGLVPTRLEQMYLHEILHALTNQFDPIKTISFRNRGPIVYFTDKILSEAGYLFPQRLSYRRPSLFSSTRESLDFDDLYTEEVINLVAQENLFLDNQVNSQVPSIEYKKVFGEELSARYTVSETNTIFDTLIHPLSEDSAFQFSFSEQLTLLFDAADPETYRALRDFYAKLYQGSDTFSNFFNAFWHKRLIRPLKQTYEVIEPWQFEIDNNAPLVELPVNKRVHCINDLTRKVYIFDDGTLYLSNRGLVPVERSRQLVHEMVQILTDLKDLPPLLALKNRGAVVQITDKIFEEVNFNVPKQLVYKLALPGDLATQSLLRSYQLEANRAALLEDKFIAQHNVKHRSSCTPLPLCRKKRFLQAEDLAQTKRAVTAKLEKYGIMQGIEHLRDVGVPVPITVQPAVLPFFAKSTSHAVNVSANASLGHGLRLVANHS